MRQVDFRIEHKLVKEVLTSEWKKVSSQLKLPPGCALHSAGDPVTSVRRG